MEGTSENEDEFSVSALAEAYGDGDIPSVWTPVHVQKRLVDAYDVLIRTPDSIGPRQFGNNWPQIVRDFAELIDEEKYGYAVATGQRRTVQGILDLLEKESQEILAQEADDNLSRSKLPTALETSMAEEALSWGLEHMQAYPLQSHALHLWAASKAGKWKVAPVLRQRAVTADTMIIYRTERRRRDLARKWTDWANERLARATYYSVAQNIRTEAHGAFTAELAKLPRIKRAEVMPNRVFTKQWMDYNRKKGSVILAGKLHKAGVNVR